MHSVIHWVLHFNLPLFWYSLAFSFTLLPFSFAGAEKLTKQNHIISGVKLRVTKGQVPSPSQLQQAIAFHSTYSYTSQVMQPPQHVLTQQVTQSERPVPCPRLWTKKPAYSLMTDGSSILPVRGLSLETAKDRQSLAEDSTIERGQPECIPVTVGSPPQATSYMSTSQSTPLRTSSIVSSVVRVVGLQPGWDERMLDHSFDNEDEGGGEIEENGIQIIGNEALIAFKDPEGK